MKKTKEKLTKKLVLSKETLRNLEREQLGLAVGAYELTAPTNCGTIRQKASCESC